MTIPAGVEQPDLQTFFVSFGVQYPREPHPTAVWAHGDGWLEVMAPDEETARDMTMAAIGRYWSFLYDEHTLNRRYFPLGALARLYPSADPIAAQEAHEDGTSAAIITADLSMVLHVLTRVPWAPPVPVSELFGE